MSEAAAVETAQVDPKAVETKIDATFASDNTKAPAAVADPKVADPKAAEKIETKDAPAAAKVAPEKYDLKAPDGSLLSAAQLEALAAYSKEKGLTQEQAQELVGREHGAIKSYVEAQQQELAKKPDAWLAESKADKEIGGDGFGKNSELAKRVIARFGSDEFKKVLNDTGLGNHPELVRVFVRMGKAMSEDTLVLPGTNAGGKKSVEELFYGKSEA